MNLYRINLNLLKVFVVLMRERHVSVAAERLHLTQPAVSNALRQLRDLFQDELLIRAPKKMIPTQKALYLAPLVEQALRQLETSLFYGNDFDCATSTRTFSLGMSDYAACVLLPTVYAALTKAAPHITLKILTYHDFLPEDFECGALDLGIGLEKALPKPLLSERLFRDVSVCVARKSHPIFAQMLTLDNYLSLKHLTTCIYLDTGLSRADFTLKQLGLSRQIAMTLPNVLPAFPLLATSDLVGTFSKNIVIMMEQQYALHYVDPPFEISPYHIAQIWHRQNDHDAGLCWLRELIQSVCRHHFQ